MVGLSGMLVLAYPSENFIYYNIGSCDKGYTLYENTKLLILFLFNEHIISHFFLLLTPVSSEVYRSTTAPHLHCDTLVTEEKNDGYNRRYLCLRDIPLFSGLIMELFVKFVWQRINVDLLRDNCCFSREMCPTRW